MIPLSHTFLICNSVHRSKKEFGIVPLLNLEVKELEIVSLCVASYSLQNNSTAVTRFLKSFTMAKRFGVFLNPVVAHNYKIS